MRLYLSFLLLGLFSGLLPAQKFIQLEKTNRAKTLKFYAGQDFTYRLKGETEWFTSTITDVDMEAQTVSFDFKPVPIGSIEAVRLQHAGILRGIGPALMVFGASWAGFSLIGAAFDDYKLTAGTAIVSGGSAGAGYLLHRIFFIFIIKLNERRRLLAVEVPVLISPHNSRP